MTTKKSIALHLDSVTLNKIKRMQQSISEPTTYAKILSGLIDMGYASALDILYADGLISEDEYHKGVLELPYFLQTRMGNWIWLGLSDLKVLPMPTKKSAKYLICHIVLKNLTD